MFSVNEVEGMKLEQISELLKISRTQAFYLRSNKRELSLLDFLLVKQYDPDCGLSFFNWKPSNVLFWNNLISLQEELGYNDEKMAELFYISLRKFRYLRSSKKTIGWAQCKLFEEKFDFSPIHFLSDDIDISCLSKIILSPFKRNSFLPKEFEGGGSKMRTLSNCFEFITKKLGKSRRRSLLHALQITEHSLTFSDKSISIKVFSILHEKLKAFRVSDEFFIEMGAYNQYNQINKVMLNQALPAKLNTFKEIFSYVITTLVGKVDINRSYKLKDLTQDEFIIEVEPTKIFQDAFYPISPFCVYETLLYVMGHIKIIPTYFELEEIKNIDLTFNERMGSAIIKGKFNDLRH